ncbi:hypothetical protein [Actinokineospora pegani]|uniref:hypothetical protein n=1 Tax=Actinokineospora pegani TaxID=2654637 RepID=UPI0012EA14CA|nr:hypothetical protein [Actinokineospora pegani]
MSDQSGQPAQEQPADAQRTAAGSENMETWGGPVPERRAQPRWSWKKTAAATAVAVGVATAGGFAVYAAGSATAEQGQRGGPGMMDRRPGSNIMGALHGEFVVSDDNGGYRTMLMQTGEVTAVTDTSITTKSADGYTKTYTIDAETVKSSVTTGDEVTILATPSGDQATADTINEPGTRSLGNGGTPDQRDGLPPRRNGDSDSTPDRPGN